jgi:ribosome maturation factor RimP
LPQQKTEAEGAIEKIVAAICEDHGLELFDVQIQQGGSHRTLVQILIDSPQGVSVGNCTTVSRELATQLDIESPIDSKFTLEVSSPGVDRPIRNLDEAVAFVGKKIKVTCAPIDNRKRFTGELIAVEEESLIVSLDGKRFSIPWKRVKKANLVFEF